MNVHALRLTQRLGFDYCSDGRGAHPHLPVWNARADPLPAAADDAADARRADRHATASPKTTSPRICSRRTREPPRLGHVFTLHAELEGMRSRPCFEQLLIGWKAQGWRLVPSARAATRRSSRWRCRAAKCPIGTVPGRSGTLFVQARRVSRRRAARSRRPDTSWRHDDWQEGKRLLRAVDRRHVQALRAQGSSRRAVFLSEGQHARLHDRGRALPRPAQVLREARRGRRGRARAIR